MNNELMTHEAEYEELDSLGDWELENDSQDIRGETLVTRDGETVGIIQDLLVDRGMERVTAVRLEDGTCCGIERLEMDDDRVIYHQAGSGVAKGTMSGHHGDQKHAEQHIPVVQEEVAIGKRMVEGGAIRVSTRVIKDDVSEDVTLRKEHVTVDRRALDRNLTPAEADALLTDTTIEVVEREEEAVVDKRAVVKEEVVISKDADTRVERVEETVRRTEVDIDRDVKRTGR